MDEDMIIQLKENLKLRKIGNQYMVVEVSNERANLCDVYSMNQIAANIWKHIGEGRFTKKEIVEWLCSTYEADRETALNDITQLLQQWETYKLIK